MRKNLFWILTAFFESIVISLSIFRHFAKNDAFNDVYSIIIFFLFEAYIFAGFFLKEMIPHRKKMIAVMFVNFVVIFFPIL